MDGVNFSQLMPMLAALKDDPEAIKVLSSLMGALSGQKSEPKPPKAEANGDGLAAILSLLQGKNEPSPPKEASPTGKAFGSQEEMKNRIALLCAVKPYLSEARQQKLETVIKLLRLAELGTLGKLLG